MIKVIQAQWLQAYAIELSFSDGSGGVYDFAPLLARETVMTRPLADREFFRRFFLDLGALCWPHGLEFGAASLQRSLAESGCLQPARQVA